VVISATPSGGDCSIAQDLLISGACFVLPDGSPNVTSVFAVELGNPANVVSAQAFVVLNNNLVDALFSFGTANAGKTFLIFVTGPNGTSRNLISTDPRPNGCPIGNEQGVQVTFTCAAEQQQPPPDVAVVTSCDLNRRAGGAFQLTVRGTNFRQGLTVTVGGETPRKVVFRDAEPGGNSFSRIILRGQSRICRGLPGVIVVTNPGQPASQPFQCSQSCQ
jgi:hypothetical protein